MAFNSLIPQATDVPATSQAQILANFTAIKQLIDVNHATFSDADEGKHKLVSFPEAATPTTLANEVALYSQESTLTSEAELFLRKESDGSIIEFTSYGSGTTGWTRLPSGILLKWGTGSATGDGTVTFPVAATTPVFADIFSCQLTIVSGAAGEADQAVRLKALTTTNFTCYGSKRTTTGAVLTGFTYLAIGI